MKKEKTLPDEYDILKGIHDLIKSEEIILATDELSFKRLINIIIRKIFHRDKDNNNTIVLNSLFEVDDDITLEGWKVRDIWRDKDSLIMLTCIKEKKKSQIRLTCLSNDSLLKLMKVVEMKEYQLMKEDHEI